MLSQGLYLYTGAEIKSCRVVQRGMGRRRALVICYLAGKDLDHALCAALGPEPCIVVYDDLEGEPVSITAQRAAILVGLEQFREIALVGSSESCLGRLNRCLGVRPSAVVAVEPAGESTPAEPWEG